MRAIRPNVSVSSLITTGPQQRCPGCFRPLSQIRPIHERSKLQHPARRRSQSTWAHAISAAQQILGNGSPKDSRLDGVSVDPLRIVGKELKFLTENIQQLIYTQ